MFLSEKHLMETENQTQIKIETITTKTEDQPKIINPTINQGITQIKTKTETKEKM